MDLRSWMITTMILALFQKNFLRSDAAGNVSFDANYHVTWGNEHVLFLDQRREVQLSMDQSSGAGFASNAFYASGFFQMRIKIPNKDTAGVVTAFYLFLNTTVHDELDFEFLGNRPGKPVSLQTNVFTNHVGGREQKFNLWFDPSADFHYYKIVWNHHQIVFFIDDIPIRIFKNYVHKGVGYPKKAMQVIVSLWDGSSWATDGGRAKANWSSAPFQANFQDFNIDGCVSAPDSPNKECYSQKHWWNTEKHWLLNAQQQKAYDDTRKKFMTYDYCADRNRYPNPPPECIG